MARPFLVVCAALATLSGAASQSLAAGAEGPVVTPPPGFSVKAIPIDGPYSAEYEVSSDADPDFGCQVGIDASKAMAGADQAQINRAAGASDYAALANASVASMFDVESTQPFSMQGVSGIAMTGVPKGGAGEVRSLMFLFQTPRGRTVVACASPPARFDVLRPTFERIARGVALSH